MSKKKEQFNYSKALEELEKIQESLENNEIGIDDLSTNVKKANELIEFCFKQLHQTEKEIEKIQNKEE